MLSHELKIMFLHNLKKKKIMQFYGSMSKAYKLLVSYFSYLCQECLQC